MKILVLIFLVLIEMRIFVRIYYIIIIIIILYIVFVANRILIDIICSNISSAGGCRPSILGGESPGLAEEQTLPVAEVDSNTSILNRIDTISISFP